MICILCSEQAQTLDSQSPFFATALEAMAKAMKAAASAKKPTLKKGKASGSAGRTGKGTLNKGDLKKLEKLQKPLSLTEKVAILTEDAENEEEAADALKKGLTKLENSKLWGRHQTFLKGQPEEEQAKFAQASKKEKGSMQLMWFIKNNIPRFLTLSASTSSTSLVMKDESWLSEKQMLKKFSMEEFQAHLNSGRVLYREDPLTKGVWQYKDQGALSRTTTVTKQKTLMQQQEYQPDTDDLDQFMANFERDLDGMLTDHATRTMDEKTLQKGKGLLGVKGKGKGKPPLLALKDGEPTPAPEPPAPEQQRTPEEEKELALHKARKMRDVLASAIARFESELDLATRSRYVSSALKKEAGQRLQSLRDHAQMLKELILKKAGNADSIKEKIQGTAIIMKSAQADMKELRHLANKTSSRAGSSASTR